MIDSTQEVVFPLASAADLLPRRRRGRPVHVSCLHRWATAGCRGIVLETLRVGGTRCTSREALQRFFEALTRAGSAPGDAAPVPAMRTSEGRRRSSEAASRELERRGA